MRRFLTAVLFGAFMAAAPTAALAQSAQAQGIVSEWYSRFLRRPIDVGALGWEQALDQGQNPDKLLSGILGSNEYFLRAGGTDPGFVQTLFADVNGRLPVQAEYALWLNQLSQLEGSVPAYEARDDVAYAMLLRYPQNWIAVAPVVVRPRVVVPRVVVPRVVVPERLSCGLASTMTVASMTTTIVMNTTGRLLPLSAAILTTMTIIATIMTTSGNSLMGHGRETVPQLCSMGHGREPCPNCSSIVGARPPTVPQRVSFRGKLVHRRLRIGLARLQNGSREIRMVHRIGKVIRFHAERLMLLVYHAVLPFQRPVQEIARVEL